VIPLYQSLNLQLALPELILAGVILSMLLWGTFRGDKSTRTFMWWAVGTLGVCIISVIPSLHLTSRGIALGGFFVADPLIAYSKIIILSASACVIAMTPYHMKREETHRFEYPVLALTATLGMMIMVSCDDLMGLFMGLELQSLSLYVLAAFRREDPKSNEAALKYFILGAVATCLILFGSSLLYGFAGTTRFEGITSVLTVQDPIPGFVLLGCFMVLAGLAFKISAAPFHMWTPDVYEGTPTTVTTFLAASPKVAAIALLARLSEELFVGSEELKSMLIGLSIISMVWGAFGSLTQTNLKRILAYSAIGHMGYALMGIIVGGDVGIQSLFIYMTLYAAMTIGVFGLLLLLQGRTIPDGNPFEYLDDLKGLGKSHGGLALGLTLLMFSMAGIPPLAGFFAKLVVFQAAVSKELYSLAIIGVLSSVVASVIYLKIIKTLWFDVREDIVIGASPLIAVRIRETSVVVMGMLILISGFCFYPKPLFEATQNLLLTP
jgi:NADH-quinone oxidoreductase subunit N